MWQAQDGQFDVQTVTVGHRSPGPHDSSEAWSLLQ